MRQFLLDGLSRELRGMHAKLRLWKRRSIAPNRIHQIFLQRHHLTLALFQRFPQLSRLAHRVHVRIDAHRASRRHCRLQPRLRVRRSLRPASHQRPILAQLLLRLHKVPSIRPQQRLIVRHHHRTRGTGEFTDPSSALETRRDVFAKVWILRRDDERAHTARGHRLSKLGEFTRVPDVIGHHVDPTRGRGRRRRARVDAH